MNYKTGLKDGMPIGIGYLSVSFTFGIMAISLGLEPLQALFISMLTLTSAGQLAAIRIMVNPGAYLEMFVSQLTINVRYAFMGIVLSQKTDSKFTRVFKWILGFFITDEIFGVASVKENVSRSYLLGLSTLPYFGWALGTLLGTLIGSIVPEFLMNALCLAIYGMFVAIIMPTVKSDKKVLLAVIISSILSIIFFYVPIINSVPSGIAISISAVLAAIILAVLFPVKESDTNE